MESFNAILNVPQISNKEEFKNVLEEVKKKQNYSFLIFFLQLDIFNDDPILLNKAVEFFQLPISIKKLIMVVEMAKQVNNFIIFIYLFFFREIKQLC